MRKGMSVFLFVVFLGTSRYRTHAMSHSVFPVPDLCNYSMRYSIRSLERCERVRPLHIHTKADLWRNAGKNTQSLAR